MGIAVLQDDRWFPEHLCELSCDESEDTVFEFVRIIDEYRIISIKGGKSLLEIRLCDSSSQGIQVFECFKEFISAIISGEKPLECYEWAVHPSSSIDPRSDLESDNVSISSDAFLTREISSESTRSRSVHLFESERDDNPVFSGERHTI